MRLTRGMFTIQKPPGAGGGYDAAAVDYFTRVETAGGSFEATQFGPTYTEAYTKTVISNFIAGLKADGVWNKIKELAMWVGYGVNENNNPAPFKCKVKYDTYPDLVQLHGTDDFKFEAFIGAGARRIGLNSQNFRSLSYNTQYLDSSLDVNSKTLGFALNGTTSGYNNPFGSYGGTTQSKWGLFLTDPTTRTKIRTFLPESSAQINYEGALAADKQMKLVIGTRRAVNDVELFANGVSVGTDISNDDAVSSAYSYYLLSANNAGTPTSAPTDRFPLFFIGTGMTATDVANFNSRWQTLYASLSDESEFDSSSAELFFNIEGLANFDSRWKIEVSRATTFNLGYTQYYTKTALDTLVRGLKTDGLWDKIYLLSCTAGICAWQGSNGSGALATTSIKKTDALHPTPNDAYAGHSQPAGPTIGLKHDSAGRWMDLRHALADYFNVTDGCTFGAYFTEFPTASTTGPVMGAYIDDTSRAVITRTTTTTPTLTVQVGPSTTMSTTGPGCIGVSAKSGEQRLYKNGSLVASDTQVIASLPTNDMRVGQATGITAWNSQTRWAFSFMCSFLDATEQANLSNRLNTCLTALGGNLY